ncbi:MAG: DUF3883 domain-containing protein [Parcubacteria group bacterium]
MEDYFTMLAAEQQGRPYVKARHAEALMGRIGRTHRSVEFKHMNISAVLRELGLPTIRGYKAKENYQNAIFPAIGRFLSAHPEFANDDWLPPEVLARAHAVAARTHDAAAGVLLPGMSDRDRAFRLDAPAAERPVIKFEEPPALGSQVRRPEGLERLVRKFDPAARDARNRQLGYAGEAHVFDFEWRRLMKAGRPDLARKVEWTSQERGDGAGYDIRSFELDGKDRLIEVKATRGSSTTPFFLSRTELEVSREAADHWQLYRLYNLNADPRFFSLKPPLEVAVQLEPENWRAAFV